MTLTAWLRSRGDLAHHHDVRGAGFSRATIEHAIRIGAARRIRRFWVAGPDAPPLLVNAAARGGRLACLSAAAHLGLWTLDDRRLHLAAPPHAGRIDAADAVIHWGHRPIPANRYELVEPVPNLLAQIAECRPLEDALVVWESAIRRRSASIAELSRMPLRPRARMVLAACSELSDSGIETLPVVRLARVGIQVRQQVPILGHRVDGLIGDRLVYQVDGYAHHSDQAQRASDLAHDRRLALAGYTVFRFDYRRILFGWDGVEAEIRMALAQRLHRAS